MNIIHGYYIDVKYNRNDVARIEMPCTNAVNSILNREKYTVRAL